MLKTILFSIEKRIMRLLGKKFLISGECRKCGRCCRNLALFLGGSRIATEEEFCRAKQAFPEYERFQIKGTHLQQFLLFSCTFQDEQNLCREYKNRPSICKTFPDPDSFNYPHRLPEGCGYEVIPLREFEEFLRSEEDRLGEDQR